MKKNNVGIDFGKLKQFADKVLEKKKNAMGYPINQNTSLDEFYKWYVEKKLYCVSMNNVGDPCRRERDSNYSMNTHEFERDVVDYFATLYGFKKNYWGFVTTSGTDGNNHGIYAGRKYLQVKSPESTPIIYYSKEVHHSVKNLADVQNMKCCQIQAEPMGKMDIDNFRQQLDPSHPALIVIAMGTTFTGAIDDLAAIRNILKEKHKGHVYIHLDAALFGAFFLTSMEMLPNWLTGRFMNLIQSQFPDTSFLDSMNQWEFIFPPRLRSRISIQIPLSTWTKRFPPSPAHEAP